MTTRIKGEQRRARVTPIKTRKHLVVPFRPKVPPELDAELKERWEAQRRGKFEILGTVTLMQTTKGPIWFPQNQGPTIAFAIEDNRDSVDIATAKLLIVSPWLGLPTLRENTTELCQDCLHTCDFCKGKGKKVCEGYQCGGRGTVPGPSYACKESGCLEETGRYNPDCKTCKGQGEIIPLIPCKVCEGTQEMTCSACHGTGEAPTGFEGGSTDANAKTCLACLGSHFQGKDVPQPLEQFVNARIGDDVLVLGPITSFVLQPPAGRPKVFEVHPDALGDFLALVLQARGTPTQISGTLKAFLVGGILQERNAERRGG
jgi:hypothetical protein